MQPPPVPQSESRVHDAPGVPPVVVPVRHTPAEHVWPVEQRTPQPPQFVTSVCVFTHTPEHDTCGLVHVDPPVQRELMHA